ncbi:MAG: ABC transporter permease [Chloroflexi bacterium]|nr:ABC transporter permease [Chloroflexota bacterium]
MSTRNRKILRDIWSRKSRTAMVSTSIFIGVLGVVTLMTVGEVMIRQMREDINPDELAMVGVILNAPGDIQPDDEQYLEELRNIEDLTVVEGFGTYPVYWREDETFLEGNIRIYSSAFEDIQIFRMTLIGGEFPNTGEKQVALERRTAEELGLEIGDTMEFRVLSITDQLVTETWIVSGIVFHPYIGDGYNIYAAPEDGRYLGGFEGFGAYFARFETFERAVEQQETFVQTIDDITPYIVVGSFYDDPAANEYISEISSWTDTLGMLGVLAMVVSTFIVFNVVMAIMIEQRRQIGVMKSLGASWGDNLLIYTGVAFSYGLIGMIPGVILGVLAGHFLTHAVAPLANIYIEGFSVAPGAIGIGVAMGLGIPLIASTLPVIFGTRVTIHEAITDLGIGTRFKRGPLTMLLERVPMPSTARQAVGNILQKKLRLMVTGLTLTLAVGSFMGVFALFYSLDEVIGDAFDTFNYQIEVQPNETSEFDSLAALISTVDGVEQIFPGIYAGVTVTKDDPTVNPAADTWGFGFTGIDPAQDSVSIDLREGDGWQNDPARIGVVLADPVAEQLNTKVGDILYVTAENGNTRPYEVLGIARLAFDDIFIPWQELASLTGFTLNAPRPNEYFVGVEIPGTLLSNITAAGLDHEVSQVFEIIDGEFFDKQESAIVISSHLAEGGDIAVGDEVPLTVNGNARKYTVTGIADVDPLLLSQFEGIVSKQADRIYMVGMFWQELAELEGRSLDGDPVPQEFIIRLTGDEHTVREVDTVIGQIRDTLLAEGISADYYNVVADEEENASLVQMIGLVFGIACVIMAVVGGIGLLVTLSMSVFERQREIGVMRSVGANSQTIIVQFLIEGLLVGIIAWLIAIPLSYGISQLLLSVLPLDFDLDYPPISAMVGFIGILVVATLASIGPSIMAARKTVSSILRYQ